MAITNVELILYVMLGAVGGMIYGLKRILVLERRILDIDMKLSLLLNKKKTQRKKR